MIAYWLILHNNHSISKQLITGETLRPLSEDPTMKSAINSSTGRCIFLRNEETPTCPNVSSLRWWAKVVPLEKKTTDRLVSKRFVGNSGRRRRRRRRERLRSSAAAAAVKCSVGCGLWPPFGRPFLLRYYCSCSPSSRSAITKTSDDEESTCKATTTTLRQHSPPLYDIRFIDFYSAKIIMNRIILDKSNT